MSRQLGCCWPGSIAPAALPTSEATFEAASAPIRKKESCIRVTGRYHRPPRRLEDDYKCDSKILGSGMNGPVFLATSMSTGEKFAVKGCKLSGTNSGTRQRVKDEAEIFLAMDHPHVVRLYDVYASNDQINFVMEYLAGGELFMRVQTQKKFSEVDAQNVAWQMLLSVNYLHRHSIVHRDLKLENYVYESEHSNRLKLIDFGLSKVWDHSEAMHQSLGSLAYVAPEVLAGDYAMECDLWSYGVIVFIMLFGYMPFSGRKDRMITNIQSGHVQKKEDCWDKVSKVAQDFVQSLIVVDRDKRLTSESALKHEWIAMRDEQGWGHGQLDQGVVDALVQFGQASQFRKACMEMMAWSLTKEEREQVRDAFLDMDKGRSGAISLHDFRQVLEERFHIHDHRAREIFASLDIDHDGEIHYEAFLAAVASFRIRVRDDVLRATFKRFDIDNDGYITREEIRSALGDNFEGESADQLLDEADQNADGRISLEEFISFLKHPDANDHQTEAVTQVIDVQLASQTDLNTKMKQKDDARAAAVVFGTPKDPPSARSCGPREFREAAPASALPKKVRSCRTCDSEFGPDGGCSVL